MSPVKHPRYTVLKSTVWGQRYAWQKATEMGPERALSWEAMGYMMQMFWVNGSVSPVGSEAAA